MAPKEAQVVFEARDDQGVILSHQAGAPEAGIPYQEKDTCRANLGGAGVVSCGGLKFDILSVDDSSITFTVVP
jgi:hypothetical protein